MGVPSVLIAVVIFFMATYLLTADYPYLRARAAQNMDEGLLRFLGQLRVTALGAFGGYLRAEVLLSCGVFVILLCGFLLMRQPYALLLALLLALLDFIPIVGAGTVIVPWAVVALFTRSYRTAIGLMIIWGVIVLYRRVMEPKFVGDQTGLSPLLSLVGIYVGMKVGGIWGMILGPILLLVLLNLSGMGMFHSLRLDVLAAIRDVSAILAERVEDA
jgi:sporulation integral membrane protein YtvI